MSAAAVAGPFSSTSAEEAVRRTIAAYVHRTDDGDYDGWAALFAEDGCFRMLGREVRGRAALRAFIEADQPPHRRGVHLTTDSVITLREGRAEVASNFLFVAAGADAGVLVTAGRYLDVLVPMGAQWLFAEREAVMLLPVASRRSGPETEAVPGD